MLVGAFIASAARAIGGRERDSFLAGSFTDDPDKHGRPAPFIAPARDLYNSRTTGRNSGYQLTLALDTRPVIN
jgi:hypothetical protein